MLNEIEILAYIHKIIFKNSYRNVDIKVYAFNGSYDENYNFAMKIYDEIKSKEHNNIYLTIVCDDQFDTDKLQDDKGFSYVRAFNKKEILARELVNRYSPCDYICSTNNEFFSLIIGFGEFGQKILERQFVYGLLPNSKIHVDIVDPDYDEISAIFEDKFDFYYNENIATDYRFLLDSVEIKNYKFNAKSKDFSEYLNDNLEKINQVVVSTGSEKSNSEITKYLIYLRKKRKLMFDVFDCLDDRIYVYDKESEIREILKVYDYILDDKIDMAGKLVNYAYFLKDKMAISRLQLNDSKINNEINEEWNKIDSYSKNSSISAAGFYKTIKKFLESYKSDDDYEKCINENREFFGKLEHNRWCAFLLTEGYRHMDYDSISGKGQKDIDNKKHACLIPWEDLPQLDAIQKSDTGKDPKYQERDIKNVIMAIKIAELIN